MIKMYLTADYLIDYNINRLLTMLEVNLTKPSTIFERLGHLSTDKFDIEISNMYLNERKYVSFSLNIRYLEAYFKTEYSSFLIIPPVITGKLLFERITNRIVSEIIDNYPVNFIRND